MSVFSCWNGFKSDIASKIYRPYAWCKYIIVILSADRAKVFTVNYKLTKVFGLQG